MNLASNKSCWKNMRSNLYHTEFTSNMRLALFCYVVMQGTESLKMQLND
jgi:hypothetical protein